MPPRGRKRGAPTTPPAPAPSPSPSPAPDPGRPWSQRPKLGKWEKAAVTYLLAAEGAHKPPIVWSAARGSWRYRAANFRQSAILATTDDDLDDCLFLLHMRTLAELHALPLLGWMPSKAVRCGLRIRVRGTKAKEGCTPCLRAAMRAGLGEGERGMRGEGEGDADGEGEGDEDGEEGEEEQGRVLRSGLRLAPPPPTTTSTPLFHVGCYYLPGTGSRCSGCASRHERSAGCNHAITPFHPSLSMTLSADVVHLRRAWEDLREELEEACDNIDAMHAEWIGASAVVDRLEKYRDRMDDAVGRVGGVWKASTGFQDMWGG